MAILLILLVLICLYGIKPAKYHVDYMSRSQTGSIKGIFAVLIFLSHVRGYISIGDSFLDKAYALFLGYLGQLIVTLFFFYSGYGILQAYKTKDTYEKGFLRKRVLKTLLHFDIAVLGYAIVSLFIGEYGWKDYLLCWIGWSSLGNSNWFIFIVLMLYLITAVAFPLARKILKVKREYTLTGVVFLGCLALYVALYFSNKESWWYDTLFCYPLGMLFAVCKPKIDKCMEEHRVVHYGLIGGTATLFIGTWLVCQKWTIGGALTFNVVAGLFCLTIVLITTVFKVDNPILRWLGKYSFSIYILQRLPMIVFEYVGLSSYKWLFVLLSMLTTLILSVCFEKLYAYIDGLLNKNYTNCKELLSQNIVEKSREIEKE